MELKHIAIIIAQILVVLGIVYLVGFTLSIPTVVENFKVAKEREDITSPPKLATLFAEMNENKKDSLNIAKHRGDYQDMLAQLQENVNLAILQSLKDSNDVVPKEKELNSILSKHKYKRVLSELQEFLDGVSA